MIDHFDGPKSLIKHARDEIETAFKMVAEFLGAQRYTNVIYEDHNTRQRVFRIKVEGPELPDKLANIVKDAAGNLRDALDHAVYSSAVAIKGGRPADTGFPFAKTAQGVIGEINGKRLRGNPPEIHALLASFLPYEGGNDTLWALNQIRNPNTHRFIVPVSSAHGMNTLQIDGIFNGDCSIGYSEWDAAKNEIEYMRLGPNTNVECQINASTLVVLEGIEAVSGKDLIPTLYFMASEAERVVVAIESETAKIIANKKP